MVRVLVWSALLSAGTGALEAQQVLTLVGGDRLTGQLLRIADGTWVFRYRGREIALPAEAIAGFDSRGAIGLRLQDGSILAAAVAPLEGAEARGVAGAVAAGAAGVAQARGPSGAAALQLTQADGTTRVVSPLALVAVGPADRLHDLEPVRIGLFSPLTRFWRATGSAGWSDQSGNSRARGIALSLELERKTLRDRLSLGGGLNRVSSRPPGGVFTATVEKAFGYVRADLYLGPQLFVFAQTRQEHDRFQDIALRSQYTGGLGFQAVAEQATDLRFWSSTGLRYETFVANGAAQEAVGVVGGSLAQRVGPAALSWRVESTPSLGELADYRVRSDASLTSKLFAGVGIRLSAVNEFNSRPRPGVKQHDMLLSTTVTYSVGR
jgi:putative salt-induced outer membrane protein YdiY